MDIRNGNLSVENTPPPLQVAEKLRHRIIADYSDYLRVSAPAEALKEFKVFEQRRRTGSGANG
jgi:hypothetical protein